MRGEFLGGEALAGGEQWTGAAAKAFECIAPQRLELGRSRDAEAGGEEGGAG